MFALFSSRRDYKLGMISSELIRIFAAKIEIVILSEAKNLWLIGHSERSSTSHP